MKKSVKMLVRGISLALVLSLVLSVTAFAETKSYTYETSAEKFNASDDEIYYFAQGLIYSGSNYTYVTNSTHKAFQMKGNVRNDVLNPYLYAAGGVFMKLPFASMTELETVSTDKITKVTLSLPFDFNSDVLPNNDNTQIVLTEVSDEELKAVKTTGYSSAAFYTSSTNEDGATVYTPSSYAPANMVNYMSEYMDGYTWNKGTADTSDDVTDVSIKTKKPVPTGIYSGYVTKILNTTTAKSTLNAYVSAADTDTVQETGIFDIDLTDLVTGGTLGVQSDRYLLIQKTLIKTPTNADYPYGSPKQPYFNVYHSDCYPVLTVEYANSELSTNATGVESHKSLNENDTDTVSFSTDYGYTITFNGEVDSTTLTEETVLVKDSEGNAIDLDGVAGNNCLTYDDATNTLTIPLPTSTTNKTETKWLTAGETYTVTLTTDIKDTAGNSVFNTDNTEVKFTMENLTYYVTETSFRTNTSASNRFAALNEGADAAKIGQTIYAYGYVQNYTAEEIPLLGIIAVYDDKGTLLQCGVMNTKKAAANMMSDTVNPSITLTQDLKEGYVIKSFIWHRNALNPFLNTSADLNTGGSKTAMTEIVVGAAATE